MSPWTAKQKPVGGDRGHGPDGFSPHSGATTKGYKCNDKNRYSARQTKPEIQKRNRLSDWGWRGGVGNRPCPCEVCRFDQRRQRPLVESERAHHAVRYGVPCSQRGDSEHFLCELQEGAKIVRLMVDIAWDDPG